LRRQNVGNLTKLVGDLRVLLAELALTSSRSRAGSGVKCGRSADHYRLIR